jgi:hypothetical protein
MAALSVYGGDVHSGDVFAKDSTRNDAVAFCDFLADIDRVADPTMEIHLVRDNGSSHTAKTTKAWLKAHPRCVAHCTPPHASWVNHAALFFSLLQRTVIHNGNFTSRKDLIEKLMSFTSDYDMSAQPFRWTSTADP